VARRNPTIRIVFGLFGVALVAGFGVMAYLSWRGGEDAPNTPGVCWREVTVKGEPHFEVVSPKVANLDSCAAALEGLHLQENRDIVGAYQSFFVFVNDQTVASASSRQGVQYPIFLPSQRATIDAGLRDMIKERGGKAPAASDLAVDRNGP
jgi:hypothetical protein